MNTYTMKEENISKVEYPGYTDIFYQSPTAIELYDSNGILHDVNPACLKLFGLKDVKAVYGFDLFSDPNLPADALSVLKSGKPARYEFTFDFDLVREKCLYETSRTGICYLECTICPTFYESNEIRGFIVYVNEITDLKLANHLLELQAEELKNLNTTKDKFFSIIAHDLKSPFNSIMGFSDLMIQNYNDLDDDTFLKGLTTIIGASEQAYKLLENLLLWARNQFNGLEFKPELINVTERISETLKLTEGAILNKELIVSFEQKHSFLTYADKNMIDLVLRNLISNAIKFSYRKGKVRILVTSNKDEILVSVSDKGVGIPESNLAGLFDIHLSKHTNGTMNEQGTGLGLILCKNFISRHGGKIWVVSKFEKGSTFTFSLPVNKQNHSK